jgi:hypothetical protein
MDALATTLPVLKRDEVDSASAFQGKSQEGTR